MTTMSAGAKAPGMVSWWTFFRQVQLRGSKSAQMRLPGKRRRTPASVSRMAVGWWAKSSKMRTPPASARRVMRRSTPGKDARAAAMSPQAAPAASSRAAAQSRLRTLWSPCRAARSVPSSAPFRRTRKRVPSASASMSSARQSQPSDSPAETAGPWARSPTARALGQSPPYTTKPLRGTMFTRRRNWSRISSRSR